MKCEILSIGSELTSGQNLDTNSQWLSRRLAEMGIAVGWHTTIADDLHANLEAFRIATQRAGLVLATGGLGPTQDDLTREVLARLAGVPLVFHPELFEQIEGMFRRRNRSMPERNRVQAFLPEGSQALVNDWGTAPGIWMKIGISHIAALPGVPSEMYAMFEHRVRPLLESLGLAGGVLIQRKINTFGAGESAVEEKLLDLTHRDHLPEVGITASDAIISLRILARGNTRDEALAQIAPVEQTIRARLGDLVFGVEEEELQHAVAGLLESRRQSLSVAECVTGGVLAQLLTSVPAVRPWFPGGIVASDNRLKVELLGVAQSLIDQKGAVSPEVAEAMAVGCRTRLKTDLAMSTTGVAEPAAASPDKPVGLVHIGLAWEGGSTAVSFSWSGTRDEIRRRTAKMALNRVRLHLLRI